LATSDAEHAVSNEAHGPCRPSTNETRPHVTEHENPVAAYTLLPAGVVMSTLANSLDHWPTLTPTSLPSNVVFDRPAACSDT
jgi:hypothetical protein